MARLSLLLAVVVAAVVCAVRPALGGTVVQFISSLNTTVLNASSKSLTLSPASKIQWASASYASPPPRLVVSMSPSRTVVVDGKGATIECGPDQGDGYLIQYVPVTIELRSGRIVVRNVTFARCSFVAKYDFGLLFAVTGDAADLQFEDVTFVGFADVRVADAIAGSVNLTRVSARDATLVMAAPTAVDQGNYVPWLGNKDVIATLVASWGSSRVHVSSLTVFNITNGGYDARLHTGVFTAGDSSSLVVKKLTALEVRGINGVFLSALGTANVSISEAYVTGSFADRCGGFLYVGDSATVEVRHATLDGGSNQEMNAANGGLLCIPSDEDVVAPTVRIYDAEIMNWSVTNQASLVSASLASVEFGNVRISGATGSGAMIFTKSSVALVGVRVTDVQCDPNRLFFQYANGFLWLQSSNATMQDVRFVRLLGSSGGILAADGTSQCTLRNCSATDVSATLQGGLFLLRGSASLQVFGFNASRCISNDTGGVLDASEISTALLDNVRVDDAAAANAGGCLSVYGSARVEVTGSSFTNCRAVGSPGRLGEGGFAVIDPPATLITHNLTLSHPSALTGPGVYYRNWTASYSANATEITLLDILDAPGRDELVGWDPGSLVSTPLVAIAPVNRTSGAVLASVNVTTGGTVDAFTMELRDAFGHSVSSDVRHPVSIVLLADDANYVLRGNDERSFGLGSSVDVDQLRVYGPVGTFVLRVTSTNPYVYGVDDSDPRRKSMTSTFALTVNVLPCKGKTEKNGEGLDECVDLQAAPPPLYNYVPSSSTNTVAIAVPVSLVLGVVACVALFGFVRWRVAAIRLAQSRATHREFVERHVDKNLSLGALELSRDSVELMERLGEGEFGEVFKARVVVDGRPRLCAAKTTRSGLSYDDRVTFVSEAEIMQHLSSPRVVALCGVVLQSEPVLLLLEFLPHGSLRQFVSGIPPAQRTLQSTIEMLETFALHVAEAGSYLERMRVVHRDLAARNCLVGQDSFGSMVVKVADFGMSKDLGGQKYFRAGREKVPVKWMAPESIRSHVFTHASDVWSFGVVVVEIFGFADTLYPGVSNAAVLSHLQSGGRLERPRACPVDVFATIAKCWMDDPAARPKFGELEAFFAERQRARSLRTRSGAITQRPLSKVNDYDNSAAPGEISVQVRPYDNVQSNDERTIESQPYDNVRTTTED